MKSIKAQIIVVIVSLIVVLGASLGVLGCGLNYRTATGVLEKSFTETAVIAAGQIAAEIKIIQNAVMDIGSDPEFANPSTSKERLALILDNQVKLYGFTRGNLLNENGDSHFDGNNYSERDYFKAAMLGKAYISDPIVSKVTGKMSFVVAAPVWEKGAVGGKVVGVVYMVPDVDFLNKLVERINPSETAYGYIINKNGTSVADINRELVGVENSIEMVKTDASLKALANLDERMIRGETGYGAHWYDGAKWVQGFAPIANTDGWSLGIMAQEEDFLDSFYLALYVTIGVTLLIMLVGIIVALMYSGRLTAPLRACTDRIELLSQGDLTTPAAQSTRKDEIGVLQNSTHQLVSSLRDMVSDLGQMLHEIAARNLDVRTVAAYGGDFAPLKEASERITFSLNEAIRQIQQSAMQVKSGSEQVSAGAQALSAGATEQASSVEELSATIGDISGHIQLSAENARRAKARSDESSTEVNQSSVRMHEMLAAMEDISDKSAQINKIVKTIDDIAFQTNILALNAAVEAARAGTAGKGFAVVAGEVRSLAIKSAEAAKNTTALIDETVVAVQRGTDIAAATARAMQGVVKSTMEISALIDDITVAAESEASAISQVSQGVSQISSVVQENSATSQESAATSQELYGQAQGMEDLASQFRLKERG